MKDYAIFVKKKVAIEAMIIFIVLGVNAQAKRFRFVVLLIYSTI